MHHVLDFATLRVFSQTVALLWEKVLGRKMTLFIWKSDRFLSSGISIIPHTNLRSSTAREFMKDRPNHIPLCADMYWSLSK